MRIGELLAGRFLLGRVLGEGTAARVFAAEDRELGRPVAVKVLTGRDELVGGVDRLRAEIEVLAQLRSPGVVPLLDAGEEGEHLFVVMELVEGGSLRDRLRAEGPLAPLEAARMVAGVAAALAEAHALGVVHRDVKPANILLTATGEPKLADFGLAKFQGSRVKTRTGIVLGTPETMAPEVLMGERVTPAADVFALGCVLFELVAGRRPHDASDLRRLVLDRVEGNFDAAALPGKLRDLVGQALAPDPGDRPTAEALARRLGRLRPEDVLAPPGTAPDPARLRAAAPAPRTPAPRPGSMRPFLLSGAGIGLVLLLVAGSRSGGRGPAPPASLRAAAAAPGPGDRRAQLDREVRDLARAWRERVREADLPARLRALSRAAVGTSGVLGSDVYLRRYLRVREGAAGAWYDPRPIESFHATPPLARELAAERDRLAELLASAEVPAARRAELFEAIQPLLEVDALLEALGRSPALGVAEVIAALVPRELTPWGSDGAPAPRGSAARLDQAVTVLAWETEVDRSLPRLDPGDLENSHWDDVVLARQELETGGAWRRENHYQLYGTFTPAHPPADLGGAWIDLRISNLFCPNVVWLRVNGVRLAHPGHPATDPGGHWDYDDPTWFRLRFHVPAALLREGVNELVLRPRPLSGMDRWAGFWVDRAELTLVAPGELRR